MLRFYWPHKSLTQLLEEIDQEIEQNQGNHDMLANLWGLRGWAVQHLPVDGITVTVMINTDEPDGVQPPDIVNTPLAELTPEEQLRVS